MSWSDDWDEELFEEGYSMGHRWASQSARRGELRRLWRYYESFQANDWDVWWCHTEHRDNPVYSIMAVIDLNSQEDWRAAKEVWERIVRRTDTDVWEPEFARGFVEGALGIEFAAEDEPDVGNEAEPVD